MTYYLGSATDGFGTTFHNCIMVKQISQTGHVHFSTINPDGILFHAKSVTNVEEIESVNCLEKPTFKVYKV